MSITTLVRYAHDVLHPNVWAVWFYRISRTCYLRRYPLLPQLIDCISRVLTGTEVPHSAQIGRDLIINHGSGLVIGDRAIIGDGCILHQGVTLGVRRIEDKHAPRGVRNCPLVGDRVVISAGAVVAGPITIGDGAIIGANAVVLEDVPPGYRAVGNPARLIPPKGTTAGATPDR